MIYFYLNADSKFKPYLFWTRSDHRRASRRLRYRSGPALGNPSFLAESPAGQTSRTLYIALLKEKLYKWTKSQVLSSYKKYEWV